ncbi:hypothetical protein [Herbidospora cretacea]|uniref:hypothetical protein n=1 Tax=Herbidospora cretacea TaxID=28444 RepID=UPI000B06D89E|nr:hypothetical protein [Herbidospora cretacea]
MKAPLRAVAPEPARRTPPIRRAGRLVAGSLTSIALLGVLSAPAAAAPTGCAGGYSGAAYTVSCTGGDGTYRAFVGCAVFTGPGGMGWRTTVYGPWATAGPGTSSTAICGGLPFTAGIQFG